MTARIVLVAAVAAAAVVVVPGASTAEVEVKFKATEDNEWNPDFAHMAPHNKALWKNPADSMTTHDVKSYHGDWLEETVLTPGDKVKKTIRKEGVYRFRCAIHSQMNDGECSGMCGILHVMK